MFGDEGALAWAKAIENPSALTSAEIRIVDSYLVNQVLLWSRVRLLEGEGLVEEGATEEAVRSMARFYFGNRLAKIWWKHERENDYDEKFVRMVDAAIERLGDDENLRWLQQLQEDVAAGRPQASTPIAR